MIFKENVGLDSKKKMTTNIYLKHQMRKIRDFRGVFSCDRLFSQTPYRGQRSTSLIVNLSKFNEPGSHWVAIIEFKDRILYFDSFGQDCKNVHIRNYLMTRGKEIYFNPFAIQHIFSNKCGYYCIGIILAVECEKSLSSFLKHFKRASIDNDYKLSHVLNKYCKYLKIDRINIH